VYTESNTEDEIIREITGEYTGVKYIRRIYLSAILGELASGIRRIYLGEMPSEYTCNEKLK